jgi:epoxyqueuosine reductase
MAHHNGACDIQAIPAMIAAGLGELGKHGSLVHAEFGASHRPGIVTTTMPLAADAPLVFGVQDTCLHCNLCSNNCPADAIPREEFTFTEGIRRWVTDVAKCYVFSRLRAEYCHICVDVCPYVHMANGDPVKRELYKRYTATRKKAGYKTPTWFQEPDASTG